MTDSTPVAEQDQQTRQLDALRSTFPGWEILIETDDYTGPWWVAELRLPLTQELADLGVLQRVRRSDGASLAAALSRQARLLHSVEAFRHYP
jgi:hypothetical protein